MFFPRTVSAYALLLLVLVHTCIRIPNVAAANCRVDHQYSCNSIDLAVASELLFIVNADSDEDFDTYHATVIFHWGVENFTAGVQPYEAGASFALSSDYQFTSDGYYDIGYTLTFGDDAGLGCAGKVFDDFVSLNMQSMLGSCEFGAVTPMPAATWPSSSPKETPEPSVMRASSTSPTATPEPTPTVVRASSTTSPTYSPLPVTSHVIDGVGSVASGPEVIDIPDPSISCSVNYQYSCDPYNSTATFDLSFMVISTKSNEGSDFFNATVEFRSGGGDFAISSQAHQIGSQINLTHTFFYENEGHYDVGYTLTFEDQAAAGCFGETFSESSVLYMKPLEKCDWDATAMPSAAPQVPVVDFIDTSAPAETPKFTLAHSPAASQTSCSIAYQSTCDPVSSNATSSVFFHVNPTASNEDEKSYNATVIFHWGLQNVTVGPSLYHIGDPISLTRTFHYEDDGFYDVGYTLTFEDNAAAECYGKTFRQEKVLTMEPFECDWGSKSPSSSGSLDYCNICGPSQVQKNNSIIFGGSISNCAEAYDFAAKNYEEGDDGCVGFQDALFGICCQGDEILTAPTATISQPDNYEPLSTDSPSDSPSVGTGATAFDVDAEKEASPAAAIGSAYTPIVNEGSNSASCYGRVALGYWLLFLGVGIWV
ncbi:hypothetical protein ACHAWF_007195 [Thalassiosira exigua]